MNQETAFLTEGDPYHLRNQGLKSDLLDEYLDTLSLGGNILDIGTQDGRRLARLKGKCFGIEPSQLAVDEGKKKYPHISLQRGLSHELPFSDEMFDVVMISYVFHWVGRKNLLKTVSEMDRVLKSGGLLIIQDFYPIQPKAVPYHYKDELFTYKQNYWEIFTATQLYTLVEKIPTIHLSNKADQLLTGGDDQAVIVSLKKI
ncbi:MAG: class I SAM-dependent methyltransferase [Candidatus Paceibacterota bacterium]|jgi:ubiquinone/menaquinone biosynthesis C-methylase UbiE